MIHPRISRRRALRIIAASGAAALWPRSGRAVAAPARWEWRGTALGAEAKIVLLHSDEGLIRDAFAAAQGEIERLENEFSLFRPDSALNRLNRTGRLAHPGLDMRRLLGEALRFSAMTDGAFDPTVQPLWDLYADHFTRRSGDADGPSLEAVAAARLAVGWQRVGIAAAAIALSPGTRLTLNGIAQGYITDRIADLLRGFGFDHLLLDLGEARAIGGPWSVAVRELDGGGRPFLLPLADCALAVSAPAGTVFEASGRWHHLFDPATGAPAKSWRAVAVRARDATTADALSTALAVTPPERAEKIARVGGALDAWLMDDAGTIHRFTG